MYTRKNGKKSYTTLLCLSTLLMILIGSTACTSSQAVTDPAADPTGDPQANLPNPASVFCEQQGYTSEIRTAADGSQTGYCIFPDGSECDEWAFYRGECGLSISPTSQPGTATEFPTQVPFTAADYQGWWSYTHPVYGFSIMLPEDWKVDEVTVSDPVMNGHLLSLHPSDSVSPQSIRMTFRRTGEDYPLWPTGVGQGEFIPQGTLDVAGEPAQRILLVCPSGEVTAVWYHQAEGQPNILRGGLEFGFIFSASATHCEPGFSLNGKVQRVGEMIIASLTVP